MQQIITIDLLYKLNCSEIFIKKLQSNKIPDSGITVEQFLNFDIDNDVKVAILLHPHFLGDKGFLIFLGRMLERATTLAMCFTCLRHDLHSVIVEQLSELISQLKLGKLPNKIVNDLHHFNFKNLSIDNNTESISNIILSVIRNIVWSLQHFKHVKKEKLERWKSVHQSIAKNFARIVANSLKYYDITYTTNDPGERQIQLNDIIELLNV